MPTSRHTPLRMCLACRQRRPKRELLRLVMGLQGPRLDPSGRQPGRGAYICPDNPACWVEKKLRRFAGVHAGALAQALNALFSPDATAAKEV